MIRNKVMLRIFLPALLFLLLINCSMAIRAGAESSTQEIVSWNNWHKKIKIYLDKIASFDQIPEQLKNDIDNAKNDDVLQKKLIIEGVNKFSHVLEELKGMDTPQEVRKYHEEIISVYAWWKEIYMAILRQFDEPMGAENTNISEYEIVRMRTELKSLEELKTIFVQHNAPKEEINKIDKSIAELKKYSH